MAKLGLLRVLATALLQAACLHIVGSSYGAVGPQLTQALPVGENEVPPHLRLLRPTRTTHIHTVQDDASEVVGAVLVLGVKDLLEEDHEGGDAEMEFDAYQEGAGDALLRGSHGLQSRRLLRTCLACAPSAL